MELNQVPEQNPPEAVRIGESFRLFDPSRTRTKVSNGNFGYKGYPMFDSRVLLDAKDLLRRLSILIHADPAYKNKAQAFAPFFPEDGYQVTAEDFNEAERSIKKDKIVRENASDIISSPLLLGVYIESAEHDGERSMTHEERLYLENLRLQVTFPNGLRFEAKGEEIKESGDTSFTHSFYPLDTGSLAPIPSEYTEGLQIALPAKLEKLQQIEGLFLSAPQGSIVNKP